MYGVLSKSVRSLRKKEKKSKRIILLQNAYKIYFILYMCLRNKFSFASRIQIIRVKALNRLSVYIIYLDIANTAVYIRTSSLYKLAATKMDRVVKKITILRTHHRHCFFLSLSYFVHNSIWDILDVQCKIIFCTRRIFVFPGIRSKRIFLSSPHVRVCFFWFEQTRLF